MRDAPCVAREFRRRILESQPLGARAASVSPTRPRWERGDDARMDAFAAAVDAETVFEVVRFDDPLVHVRVDQSRVAMNVADIFEYAAAYGAVLGDATIGGGEGASATFLFRPPRPEEDPTDEAYRPGTHNTLRY